MKKFLLLPLISFLISCNSEPSLQKYMVKNSESAGFIALDFGSDILKFSQNKLNSDEKEALKAFKKINILAFKKNPDNETLYTQEKEEVQGILKSSTKYEKLLSFGKGSEGVSVYCLGNEDTFNEFVIFGNQKETGFAIVRILGKKMTPNHIVNMMSVLKKVDSVDNEQLKSLEILWKN